MSLVVNHNLSAMNADRNLNSHYSKLATSTQRLSSGLRVNSAADDAAGLAIREMQRADIAAYGQGARNANDTISLIQTADGALQIIDEKLIRMKELAEQAATGTYDSTQRLMIDSEFQAMAAEIDRIANATNFNGIYLLNGDMQGTHNGSGLTSSGSLKIHFGPGNDSAEDYYYLNVNSATTVGLGLRNVQTDTPSGPLRIDDVLANGIQKNSLPSGVIAFGIIPAGSTNVNIWIDGLPGAEDDIQIFTKDGVHIVGTPMQGPGPVDVTWSSNPPLQLSMDNGFNNNAAYVDNLQQGLVYVSPESGNPLNSFTFNGMTISYSGDYDYLVNGNTGSMQTNTTEAVHFDVVTEDIILFVTGMGVFNIKASWDDMIEPNSRPPYNIATQDNAQSMLDKISKAIVKKDNIRAHLGAMQNRLENTVTNLNIQAENLQVSESRISDTDVSTEMTEFVRNQILTQAAVAMLAQANSLPKMVIQIIEG